MRADHELAPLAESSCATSGASARATVLVGAAALTHAPLGDVIAGSPPATSGAENLSRAVADPAAVLAAWRGSTGHRANLLDPNLTELGVGCVSDGAAMLCAQIYLGP